MIVLRVPSLGANDDAALVHWEVPPGTPVRKGQAVAQLETTKATFTLEAPKDGFVYYILDTGASAEKDARIAVVDDDPKLSADVLFRALYPDAPAASAPVERRVSIKAQQLADANGVTLADVSASGDGVVREADVVRYLGSKRPAYPADLFDDLCPHGRPARLVVIGAGRAAIQVLELVARLGGFRPVGLVDDDAKLAGKTVMGVPVLGPIADLADLHRSGRFDQAILAIGGSCELRKRTFKGLREAGVPFANLVDPSASVSPLSAMGQGNVILAHAHVGAGARLGDDNYLSAYTSIEHHCQVGSHCLTGPGVLLSGGVRVGDEVRFGTGIFIEPDVVIGEDSVIGSGTVLVGDVDPHSLVKTRVSYQIERKGGHYR